MKSHFELTPAEYEARRQGHLQRRRIDLVAGDAASRVRAGDLVVELGCGPGDVLAAVAGTLPGADLLGIDLDDAMVQHARLTHGGPRIEFRMVDITDQRLERRARYVFGIDVLHHVLDLSRFVSAVAALLEPDGLWTVIEPNSRNPYIWIHQERMQRAGLDEDHFRRRAFEDDAARAGLRILRRSTAFTIPGFVSSVPSPFAAAERLLERVDVLGGSVVYRLSPA